MSSQMKQIKAIKRAIKSRNIPELKRLAIKHGFLSDKLRKKAWPIVLGINMKQKRNLHKSTARKMFLKINSKLPPMETTAVDTIDYRQIEQDIARTSLDYLHNEADKEKCCESVGKILHNLFDRNNCMHYLQGFNDVTAVLYTVCRNSKLAQKISRKMAETYLSDYIMDNNQYSDQELNVTAYKLIFDIIECHDMTLSKILGHDFIAISISWLITWFAHQVKDINVISRIYDYCLCSDKLISSYLSAALMIYLKKDLLQAHNNNKLLFEYFIDLDWNQVDFNEIINISQCLYTKYASTLNENFKAYNDAMHDQYLSDSAETPLGTPIVCSLQAPSRSPSSFDLLNDTIPDSMKEDHFEHVSYDISF